MTTPPATDFLPSSPRDAAQRIRLAAGVFDVLEWMPTVKDPTPTPEALINQVCHDQQLSYSPEQVTKALHDVRHPAGGEKSAHTSKPKQTQEEATNPIVRLMAAAGAAGLISQALGGPFYLNLTVAMAGAVLGLLRMRYWAYLSRSAVLAAHVTPASPTKTAAVIQTGWSLAGMAEDFHEVELDLKDVESDGHPEMTAFDSQCHYSYREICKRQKAIADEQRARRLALYDEKARTWWRPTDGATRQEGVNPLAPHGVAR